MPPVKAPKGLSLNEEPAAQKNPSSKPAPEESHQDIQQPNQATESSDDQIHQREEGLAGHVPPAARPELRGAAAELASDAEGSERNAGEDPGASPSEEPADQGSQASPPSETPSNPEERLM